MILTRFIMDMFRKKRVSREKSANYGRVGEDIASRFLERKGHILFTRNFRRKWGEVDIVTILGKTIHFVEVKTVSREKHGYFSRLGNGNPEDRVDSAKLKKLQRVINSFLAEYKRAFSEYDWQIDVVAVDLDQTAKMAKIRHLEGVFL